MYGETHQANYLINAKERNSESKSKKSMLCDRTNNNMPAYNQPGHRGSSTKKDYTHPFDAPVSPFKDMSSQVLSIRDGNGKS